MWPYSTKLATGILLFSRCYHDASRKYGSGRQYFFFFQSVVSNWQLSSDNQTFISFLLVCDTKMYISLVVKGSTETLNRVTIVAPPQNATVMLGRPSVMECMAQGQPKPLVSWSRQGNAQKCSLSCFSVYGSYPD